MAESPQHPFMPAAIEAVSSACSISRAVQANLEAVRTATKDDRSPVTVADYAVQAIVALVLADHLPEGDRLLIGEEDAAALRGDDQAAIRGAVVEAVRAWRGTMSEEEILDAIDACDHEGSGSGYWVLDPVDGTKGFLRGQHYAIALGRVEEGEVVAGVMGCPNLSIDQAHPLDDPDPQGVVYAASRGAGAWEFAACDPLTTPMRIVASQYASQRPLHFCESAERAHSNRGDAGRIIDTLEGVGEPARLDSQCKYALVARGQADAYLRLPTRADYIERAWDHAAGCCIAMEAGAVVSDIDGRPLDFSHGAGLNKNRGVICAIDGLHQRIIETIADLAIAQG